MNRLFGLFDHLLRSYQVIWLWVNRFQWKFVEFRKIKRQITSKLLKKRTIFESNESVTQFECRNKYSNKNVNWKQGVATRTQTKTLPNRIWNNKLNLNCCFFLSSLHFWNSIFCVCVVLQFCYGLVELLFWLGVCLVVDFSFCLFICSCSLNFFFSTVSVDVLLCMRSASQFQHTHWRTNENSERQRQRDIEASRRELKARLNFSAPNLEHFVFDLGVGSITTANFAFQPLAIIFFFDTQ